MNPMDEAVPSWRAGRIRADMGGKNVQTEPDGNREPKP